MNFKFFPLAVAVVFMAGVFTFCTKENNDSLLPENGLSATQKTMSGNTTNDRGLILQLDCNQKTVHYTELASTGSPSSAFTGNWVQELDRIANNCRAQSACERYSSSGQNTFCCTQELFIYDILQSGGFGQSWPMVTPAEQNYIIDYTLNYARTRLPACSPGVQPSILAVDYIRDPFITSSLIVVVRWGCCDSGGGSHE